MRAAMCVVIALLAIATGLAQQRGGPALDDLAAARPADWLPVPVLAARAPWVGAKALGYLADADPITRAQAAFLVGDTHYAPARRKLVALLDDPVRQVRMHAGIALCRLGDSAGLKTAAAVLGGAREWMKFYAVVGLVGLGSKEAKQALEDHAYGQPPLVATAIQSTLGQAPRQPSPHPEGQFKSAALLTMPAATDWPSLLDEAYSAFIAETDWWWHRGNYDQCIRCNDVLVFLDPQADDPYTDNGWLLWSMGRHTRAIGMYHRCIDRCTVSNQGNFHLGFYYFQHKLIQEAEPYLRRAVQQDPKDQVARRMYAHCLEKLGRLAEAKAQWEMVLRQHPTDGAAKLNLRRIEQLLARDDP